MSTVRKAILGVLAALATLAGATTVLATPALAGEGLGVVGRFGEPGSGPGQLALIPSSGDVGSGLAVNSAGDVYVADTDNDRIEWFNPAGTYQGQFNGIEIDGKAAGAGNEAPEKLSAPEAIAIDNDASSPSFGDVYVADPKVGVIDKFSASGDFLGKLSVGNISAVAVDQSGDLWATALTGGETYEYNNAVENQQLTATTLEGAGYIEGLAVDSEDNLYTTWGGIQKHSDTGVSLGSVCGYEECGRDVAIDPHENDLFAGTGTSVLRYGAFGEPFEAPIETSKPNIVGGSAGIAVDPTSATPEVYIADAATDQVVHLTVGATPAVAPEAFVPEEAKASTAIFHGKLEPPATKFEYYFEYNIGSSCSGGQRTLVKEGEGEVREEVTKLEPREEYSYCIVEENAFGASEPSTPVGFSTEASAPTVVSETAANIEYAGQLQFSAVIDPNHSEGATTYYFEYATGATGETLEGTIDTAEGGSIGAEEYGEVTVSSEPVDIAATHTYYYRIVATNSTGTTRGSVMEFTKLPIVDREAASGMTLSTVELEASINPNWEISHYHFEYATSEAAFAEGKALSTPHVSTGGYENEFEEIPVSVAVEGLQPFTVYYYRVAVENATTKNATNANMGHEVTGAIESFRTWGLPVPNTGAAEAITATAATLSGTVDPRGLKATYYFQYIDEALYQTALDDGAEPYAAASATPAVGLEAGEAPRSVGPSPASGLLPETVYHYRLVATNQFGVEYGESKTFTTGSKLAPQASTGIASGISQNSATLTGTVDTNGLATDYGFEVGTESGRYGPPTGLGSISGSVTETATASLTELQPVTTYYYRLEASNADGVSYGQQQSFTTPAFPSLLAPQSTLPILSTPATAFPKGNQTNTARVESKARKLKKALKKCKKDKGKRKRTLCEKRARRKYGTAKKKK